MVPCYSVVVPCEEHPKVRPVAQLGVQHRVAHAAEAYARGVLLHDPRKGVDGTVGYGVVPWSERVAIPSLQDDSTLPSAGDGGVGEPKVPPPRDVDSVDPSVAKHSVGDAAVVAVLGGKGCGGLKAWRVRSQG